ncbi:hypothetical protein AB0B04_18550 [Streptomyces xinghaiensis]|uniref:Uncharacterized protein n=2 Tax=Streptomyces TaxID=1883 RepID=A0A3R7INL4_9ACTN|nr:MULTISPECIES: hypothetical protein [Streptomyces]KNE81428.1 hypothetical protein ADZ36_16830 [Streptomyces fradiae]OFA48222.1 hypothetical protein BEN35_18935 [Streptomyces fradiae]PQM20710.1 hypothetical protein Sfr7A_26390 [Streptomyces xinghaiensis]RKM92651.1 hypothetical protein SFRA_025045 [Streptomyces xinghaiensis]RNC70620.1 hypothetical protein DC095_026035 [Streptomyces xinghaiensis]
MADELHLPLTDEERERLAEAAAERAQTPEEYVRSLVAENIDGRFLRALQGLRAELPALAAHEAPEVPVVRGELPADEAPMSSRDLGQDRSAA